MRNPFSFTGHNNGYTIKMSAVSGMIIIRFVEDMNGGELRHVTRRPSEIKVTEEYIPQVKPSEIEEKQAKEILSPREQHRPAEKIVAKRSLAYKNSFQRLNSSAAMSRPILKVASNYEKDRGMTDKLHNLMASYLSKDVS